MHIHLALLQHELKVWFVLKVAALYNKDCDLMEFIAKELLVSFVKDLPIIVLKIFIVYYKLPL